MQNPQMQLFGILGSPGCEDLEVTVIKKGPHYGKEGKIWCFNRKVGGALNLGGKGRYVVEVDLAPHRTKEPRSRSYISHLFATLLGPGKDRTLRPDVLLKRMKHLQEIQHTSWLACWADEYEKGILVLNRIAGILTEQRYKEIVNQHAKEKKEAMSINLGDHPDDDEDILAEKRKSRAIRRRKEIERLHKLKELAIHLEESKDIKITLKEFLLFARESEIGRVPTLLDLLASDFTVKQEEEASRQDGTDTEEKRICILRRRLGMASQKKYALLRWKGLPPPQSHNVKLFSTIPSDIIVRKKTDPYYHPSLPILRILILLKDPPHMNAVVYIMKRVAHRMRLKICITECLTIEKFVAELVQNEQNDDGTNNGGINLCFIQDALEGMSADQLKRSLELSKVAVPTIFCHTPETTPPSYGKKTRCFESPTISSQSSCNSLVNNDSLFSRSLSSTVFPTVFPTVMNGQDSNSLTNGHNHQLPNLVHALDQDPLGGYPGHNGPGCENTVGVPWTVLCMPFTRANILNIFENFWLPLQYLQHRPWSYSSNSSGSAFTKKTRPPPPNSKQFLGKSAANTLQFQHKSGLGRSGIITWYASTQHDLVRNVPNIEKQWQLDADNSLKPNGRKLNLGTNISKTKRLQMQKKQNVLFSVKVKVQRKQVARRMREHVAAQSKIVLDLLPGR
jgi:hypothetical protein